MDSTISKRLNTWLRRQFFGRNEKVTKLQIRHIVQGGKVGSEVDTINIEEMDGDVDEIVLDKIMSQIELICEGDAEALEGMQKYCILPFFEGSKQPNGRLVLSLNLSSDFAEESLDSEGPSKTGIISQMMRHTEAFAKISMASTGNTIAMQNRIIARQAEQIETMMGRQIEMVSLIENLKSLAHERDLDTAHSLKKTEMMGDIFQKIMLLAPVVVNKIGGKNLLPAKTTATEDMVVSFFKSLRPEQIEKVAGVLTPEQQIVIFNFMETIVEKDEAEKKTKNGAGGFSKASGNEAS